MRIALISDDLGAGGAERQMVLCASGLVARGHDVDIIIYHPTVRYRDALAQQQINLVQINASAPFRLGRLVAMARLLAHGRYTVVHAFKGVASLYGALAARLAGCRVVLGGYRCLYQEGRLLRTAHRLIDPLLSGWIVNTEAIRGSIHEQLGIAEERLQVVPNGVTPEPAACALAPAAARARLGLPDDCPVVTMVARLHPQKDHQTFLQMAAIIVQQRPGVRFLLAGGGCLLAAVQDQVDQLQLGESVQILGERSDIPEILAATDVVVLSTHREGLPNALIEAMSRALPVVASDFAGVDELLTNGENGCVVARGDAVAMAGQVVRLLDDAQLRARLGAAGRRTVEQHHDPARMVERMLTAYQWAIDRATRAEG